MEAAPAPLTIPLSAAVLGGVVSGVASLLVFLVVHHVWIKPIWIITLPGLAIAALGGAAIGWAYFHVQGAMPARPLSWLLVLAIILATLLPGMLLSLTHGPLFDLATAKIRPGEGAAVALRFFLELVVPAVLVGAAIGWRLGGTPAAAGTMALAAFAFALGPGHNVPMFGNTPAAFKGFALLGLAIVPVALGLVEGAAFFARR